jgi:hypothetical protein
MPKPNVRLVTSTHDKRPRETMAGGSGAGLLATPCCVDGRAGGCRSNDSSFSGPDACWVRFQPSHSPSPPAQKWNKQECLQRRGPRRVSIRTEMPPVLRSEIRMEEGTEPNHIEPKPGERQVRDSGWRFGLWRHIRGPLVELRPSSRGRRQRFRRTAAGFRGLARGGPHR